jgi:hypothetical protein
MMYPYLRTFMTVATQMVARFNGSTAYDKNNVLGNIMIEGGKRYLKFENGTDLIPCSCRNITVSKGKFYRMVNF